MSILSDTSILKEIENGEIIIDPFDNECLGSNSYDIHLGDTLGIFKHSDPVDAKGKNEIDYFEIDKKYGSLLEPNVLYLGITKEYTKTGHALVPNIDGKSSIGRLGIFIHVTAGRGDAGYAGFWTLEIVVVHPTIVYAGMPIGQLTYERISGHVKNPYDTKDTAKYTNKDPKPIPSMMWKNWNGKKWS